MAAAKKAPAKRSKRSGGAVRLKDVAAETGLSIATVSLALNRSRGSDAIPADTQERVRAAASRLGYRPNQLARSLRSQKTQTVGILVPSISEGYEAAVLAGIERELFDAGYFYLVASHDSQPQRIDQCRRMFEDRQVEGLIVANTPMVFEPTLPVVSISGAIDVEGVSGVVLDHDRAAQVALDHLFQLGHRDIAFFKGPVGSADSEARWQAIAAYAQELGLEIPESRVVRLGAADPAARIEVGYEEGLQSAAELLRRTAFSALFSFNDLAAIGAAKAFTRAGLRVPQDVSVVGFDDIPSASFHQPGLTTVRQPLREMGRIAARLLLQQLEGAEPRVETVLPELVVRNSTAAPFGREA